MNREMTREEMLRISGARLRDLRGIRTQQEIADAVGVTAMAVSQYERGERLPGPEVMAKLAKLFGRTVDSLFFAPEVSETLTEGSET